VTYTTVLEAQRRSFDAQTTVIELTNQLLQNRVETYLALGGDYFSVTNPVQQKSQSQGNSLPTSLTNRTNMEK